MPHKAPEKLFKKFKITAGEKRKYVFDELRDFHILDFSKKLEKGKLTEPDMEMVKLIKTQLYADWRKPLLHKLEQLQKRYSKM